MNEIFYHETNINFDHCFYFFNNDVESKAFAISTNKIDTAIHPKVQDKISERTVYSFCTKSASFPGGNDALMRFLHVQINDPKLDGITGCLIVRFVVEKDGQITNVTIKPRLRISLFTATKYYFILTSMSQKP